MLKTGFPSQATGVPPLILSTEFNGGLLAGYVEANADRHDQALSRLEANVNRHDDALNRMENAIANLTDRLDAFAEQSASERKTFIAEIREIWRYLRYEPGNGTSDSNG